jgi:inositol-hexakisphosphate 5-kinase
MQVWDAKNKGYIFQDKYYGRDLHAGKDFQNALTRYITSTAGGEPHVLTYHITTILSKINQLGMPPLYPLNRC